MEGPVSVLTICRICLIKGELVPINGTEDTSTGTSISTMLSLCCGVEFNGDVDLPSNICRTCLSDLQISYKLRKTSEQSEAILQANLAKAAPLEDTSLLIHQDQDLIIEDGHMGSTESLYLNEDVPVDPPIELQDVDAIIIEPKEKSVQITQDQRTENSKDLNLKGTLFCDICQRSFSRQDILTIHIRRHTDEKNFICNFCGKKFVNNFEMKRHSRTHTGEKPYPCNYCDKTFSDFTSRKKHLNVHTQKRPYLCKLCNKSFNYSNVLQAHMTVHTGEKKHKCSICSKTFSQPHHLKKHSETHVRRNTVEISKLEPDDGVIELIEESNWSSTAEDLIIEEVK